MEMCNNMKQMVKPSSEAAWGNRFGYLHVRIPMEKLDNPLDILGKVKENLDRKKILFAIFMVGKVLGYVTKLKGPQVHPFQLLLSFFAEIREEMLITICNVMLSL